MSFSVFDIDKSCQVRFLQTRIAEIKGVCKKKRLIKKKHKSVLLAVRPLGSVLSCLQVLELEAFLEATYFPPKFVMTLNDLLQ